MIVVDTFNRPNESPVSAGGKWSIGGVSNTATAPKVVSNALQRNLAAPTFARDNAYRNDITYGVNVDCEVGVTITQMSNDGEVDLSLFNTGTRNGYKLLVQSASFGTPQLVLTTSTGLVIDANASVIPASGDTVVLQIIGDAVTGWINRSSTWTQVLGATDTTYRQAFNPGIEVVGNNDTVTMILDNFGSNVITAAASGSWDGGFVRDTSGAIVRGSGSGSWDGGFVRDSAGRILFGASSPFSWQNGYLRDSTGALVESTGPGSPVNGLQRDSSGALVTVSLGSAVAPLVHENGLLYDANGHLVTD